MVTYAYSPSDSTKNVKPYILQDLNLGYSQDSSTLLITDLDVIFAMIYNILFTIPGTREFEPTFGSDIPMLLHAVLSKQLAWQIENLVTLALAQWHPYVIAPRNLVTVSAQYAQGIYQMSFTPALRNGILLKAFQAQLITPSAIAA